MFRRKKSSSIFLCDEPLTRFSLNRHERSTSAVVRSLACIDWMKISLTLDRSKKSLKTFFFPHYCNLSVLHIYRWNTFKTFCTANSLWKIWKNDKNEETRRATVYILLQLRAPGHFEYVCGLFTLPIAIPELIMNHARDLHLYVNRLLTGKRAPSPSRCDLSIASPPFLFSSTISLWSTLHTLSTRVRIDCPGMGSVKNQNQVHREPNLIKQAINFRKLSF